MELVNHPLVGGPDKRVGLFWFTISPLFTAEPQKENEQPSATARYLERPDLVFKDIWATADRTNHSLSDEENHQFAHLGLP